MKMLRVLALVLWCLPVLAGQPLKVVSWNIEWFPGGRSTAVEKDSPSRMRACQEELRKMNPDIFIGIEMRDWDVFHELCSAVPGLTVHAVSTFRDPVTGDVRPQQIGVASKLRCVGAWWEAWKENVPETPRGYVFAALKGEDGKLVMVYGNHFKSNLGSDTEEGAKKVAAMRNDQARQLLAHMKDAEKLFQPSKIRGWVAAGDFNTNHDGQFADEVVSILESGGLWNSWSEVPREKRLTWRADPRGKHKPTTFDYIFLRGFEKPKASVIEVPRKLSDHYPVTVTLP